jgi:hypothetical protein
MEQKSPSLVPRAQLNLCGEQPYIRLAAGLRAFQPSIKAISKGADAEAFGATSKQLPAVYAGGGAVCSD